MSKTFTATRAKNEFGRVLEAALQDGIALITRHDEPKAVVLSFERFKALTQQSEAKLAELDSEFDSLLARMQGPKAHRAFASAFSASPARLGRAAVAASRKRG
jgi:prevent-host-death family protein